MARKVVCKICKAKGTNDTFYKITDDKGRSKYYCNKEEYDLHQNEKLKRENLLKFIAEDVFNYEEGQIIHPIMIKKLSELNKFYDNEVILECFIVNKESIQYWIGAKQFSSEYNMVCYVMKIIEGSINDVFNKWKHQKKQEIKQTNDTVDFDILNEMDTKTTTNNDDNSILAFLDEEDM